MLLSSPKVDRDLAIPPQTLGRFPWRYCHLTRTPRWLHSAGPFSIAATPLFSPQPARAWLYALVCSLITCLTVHLSTCLCPCTLVPPAYITFTSALELPSRSDIADPDHSGHLSVPCTMTLHYATIDRARAPQVRLASPPSKVNYFSKRFLYSSPPPSDDVDRIERI